METFERIAAAEARRNRDLLIIARAVNLVGERRASTRLKEE